MGKSSNKRMIKGEDAGQSRVSSATPAAVPSNIKSSHGGERSFVNILLGIMMIIALTYSVISFGSNLSAWNEMDRSREGTPPPENSVTAMAIGGLESITGWASGSIPAKGDTVVEEKKLSNGHTFVKYQRKEGTFYYIVYENYYAKENKGGGQTEYGEIGDYGKIERSSDSNAIELSPDFVDLVKSSEKSATEYEAKYNSELTELNKDLAKKGFDGEVSFVGDDGSCTLTSSFKTEPKKAGNGGSASTEGEELLVHYNAKQDGTITLNLYYNEMGGGSSLTKSITITSSEGSLLEGTKYTYKDDKGKSLKDAKDIANYLDVSEDDAKKFLKQADLVSDIKNDVAELAKLRNGGVYDPATRQQRLRDLDELSANIRGKLSAILNAYMNDWLGDFTQGVPAMICGDSLYKKDSSEDKKIAGIPVPSTQFGSQKEADLLNNIRTVVIEGEKTQVSKEIFRYAVTLKLIGNANEEWRLWLYNSKTKESSFDISVESDGDRGWYEYGSISNKAFYGNHWAFQLICGSDGSGCIYDQACFVFTQKSTSENSNDEEEPSATPINEACVDLVYGQGFLKD